jgi:hypothetical protein
MADDVTRPYRPSNGTEGRYFMAQFCERCQRDARFQETQDGEDGCPIALAAMIYERADPEYPKEWIVDDNDPTGATARCTAFEPIVARAREGA